MKSMHHMLRTSACLLLVWLLYGVDPRPMTAFPCDASGEIRVPEIDKGSIFTFQAHVKRTMSSNASTPLESSILDLTPIMIDNCRVFRIVDGFAFVSGDNTNVPLRIDDNDQNSTWRQLRTSLNPTYWSWDGTTCFTWHADRTVRRANGAIAWTIPSEIQISMQNSIDKFGLLPEAEWNKASLPSSGTFSVFVSGAISRDRIGLAELVCKESLDGSKDFAVSWLLVDQAGVTRFPLAKQETSIKKAAFQDAYTDGMAWCSTGGAAIFIPVNVASNRIIDRREFNEIHIQTVMADPKTNTMARNITTLGKGANSVITRYGDGLVACMTILGSTPFQIVGIDGDHYPFRQMVQVFTRTFTINPDGTFGKSWIIPGAWTISKSHTHRDAILLTTESDDFRVEKAAAASILFNPRTGDIAATAVVCPINNTDNTYKRIHVTDGILNGGKSAYLVTVGSASSRGFWEGDKDIVSIPKDIPLILPEKKADESTPQLTSAEQPSVDLIGSWTIIEGESRGNAFIFNADGTWISPWGDFRGQWRCSGSAISMTANRQVTANIQGDGTLRVKANITLVLKKK